MSISNNTGKLMKSWATDLFPICRSITGNGFRETMRYIKNILPELKIYEVPSGTKAFDWTVPDEWNIKEAYIEDKDAKRIIDFQEHNLHIMGYSIPVDKWMDLEELDQHLHSLPDQPEAIPYVTSYYKRNWGFCLTHKQRKNLKPGEYHVVIKSELKTGILNYGELIIKGMEKKEIFLSTYICHPSMANNELSGPVVTTALVDWLKGLSNRKYTYRIVFLPETIGAIVYLSKNLKVMKSNIIAGFQITCVGDNRCYSYLPSRQGDTYSDRVALHVLKHIDPDFKKYSYLDRGSDEREYCSPGVDLPVASVMRSKYGEYPEYHTSLDNLDLITFDGLQGSYNVYQRMIECIEFNNIPRVTVLCEPQLGKRGLYPQLSTKNSYKKVKKMMDLLAYADGEHDFLEIAEIINTPIWELMPLADKLINEDLLLIHLPK